jgi:hypothetical protein
MEALQKEGVPSHIRIDKGGENRKIALMMTILLDGVVDNPVFIGASTSNQKIERWWRDCRRYCLQTYKGMFEHFEALPIPNKPGNFYLQRYDKNHLFLLQYLFMHRINQSLEQFTATWNHHTLRLPPQFHHIHPLTGNITKSWVPETVYHNHPDNYTISPDVLTRITDNNEYCSYLFEDDNDDDDDDDDDDNDEINYSGLEINDALWSHDPRILDEIYAFFLPLTIKDSIDDCVLRYKAVIDFINEKLN